MGGGGHRTGIEPESVGGIAPVSTNTRGASGSEAGGACCGEIVTATGEGDVESCTYGCEPSSADGIGTDITNLPRMTAPTTAAASATATCPTGLD